MKKIVLLLFTPLFLFSFTPQEIVEKIEDTLNGKSAYLKLSMVVTTKRGERTMKMESRSLGKEKSFIKILYPRKDKGITFLKLDKQMWQYVPKIERVIKIPSSMMGQGWMGSDLTNDDMVKESSISDDYDTKIVKENSEFWRLELTPKEEAAVVWGKLEMEVSKKYTLPVSVRYYDEDFTPIRDLFYKDIQKMGDRDYPTLWEVISLEEDKRGRKTVLHVLEAKFDIKIDENYFTKHALKRFSR